ncbi:MAG: DUF4397 domain-containing protein [Candidatus Kapabacteria bacterium]|jgi:hypothetical protein|nr:DUF4397 domain-containing protein [Candidatus Kapabacteria bacterium]
MKRFVSMAVTLVLGASALVAQNAQVQIIHNAADPSVNVVDIYINGKRELDNVAFRTATEFLPIPANTDLSIAIAPGTSESVNDAVATFPVRLPEGRFVVVANGVRTPSQFAANPDPNAAPIAFNLFPLTDIRATASVSGNVDLLIFHGATDAPAVDVVAGTQRLRENISYGKSAEYLSLPAGEYVVGIAPTGADPIAQFEVDVRELGGAAAVVLASGFLNPAANQSGPAFGLFVALPSGGALVELPVFVPPVQLQLIHNAADPLVSEVDIYINGERRLDNFAFRTATSFLELPADTDVNVGIALRNSESVADVAVPLTINLPSGRYVAVANGVITPADFKANTDQDAESIGFEVYSLTNIRPSASTAGNVDFVVFHGATDAPKVDVLNGDDVLIPGLSYGRVSDYRSVPAASYNIGVAPAGAGAIARFTADLSNLTGQSIVVLASGFLSPAENQNGPAFGLLAVLPDGTSALLPPLSSSVSEVLALPNTVVMPNPTSAISRIAFTQPAASDVRVSIVDATGSVLSTQSLTNVAEGPQTIAVDTTPFASGMYTVQVTSGSYRATLPLAVVR